MLLLLLQRVDFAMHWNKIAAEITERDVSSFYRQNLFIVQWPQWRSGTYCGVIGRAVASFVFVALILPSTSLQRGGHDWQLTVRHPIRLCSKGRWKARGSPHQSSNSVAAVWKFAGFCKCWKGGKREIRNMIECRNILSHQQSRDCNLIKSQSPRLSESCDRDLDSDLHLH